MPSVCPMFSLTPCKDTDDAYTGLRKLYKEPQVSERTVRGLPICRRSPKLGPTSEVREQLRVAEEDGLGERGNSIVTGLIDVVSPPGLGQHGHTGTTFGAAVMAQW